MAAVACVQKFHLPLPHFCFLRLPGQDCAESDLGSSDGRSRSLQGDLDHSFLVSMGIFIVFFRSLVICFSVCTREDTSSQILDLFVLRVFDSQPTILIYQYNIPFVSASRDPNDQHVLCLLQPHTEM